jgi:catechol 2,3-dioxygenase-like lactoylglutathione lyase family enzyme
MPLRIDHIVIAVSEWERSNAFSRDVPGAEIVPLGPTRFAYAFGDQRLNVHGPETDVGDLVAREPVRPGNSDLCLEWPGPARPRRQSSTSAATASRSRPAPVERPGARGVESCWQRDGAVENATLAGKSIATALATFSGRIGGFE